MPFPISLKGSFRIPVTECANKVAQSVETAICGWLETQRVRDISRTAVGISFRAGLLRDRSFSSLSPLVVIDSGEISDVSENGNIKIIYRFKFTEFLFIWSAVVAVGFVPLFWETPILAIFAWFAMPGLQYLISWYRVPNALKSIAQKMAADTTRAT